jgi:hypothetical protein
MHLDVISPPPNQYNTLSKPYRVLYLSVNLQEIFQRHTQLFKPIMIFVYLNQL